MVCSLLLGFKLRYELFFLAFLTADGVLLTVWSVESVEWALFKSLAGRGLHCLPNVVAWLTEVVGTETEPSSCFATVAALKHDMFCSMLLTVSLARCFPY